MVISQFSSFRIPHLLRVIHCQSNITNPSENFRSMSNDNRPASPPPTKSTHKAPLSEAPASLSSTTRRHRRRFTIQQKLALLRVVKTKIDQGMSKRAACEDLNIHHTMYSVWVKQFQDFVQARNTKSKSLCPGRISALASIQNELRSYITEELGKQQGMAVSISMVMHKAAQLSTEFAAKSRIAQYSVVRRFMHSNGFDCRRGTHTSSSSSSESDAASAIQER